MFGFHQDLLGHRAPSVLPTFCCRYYLDNRTVIDIFDIFVYATFLPTTFLVVIVVTTIITDMKLRSALAWRRSLTTVEGGRQDAATSRARMVSKEAALTRMLIASSILFIVCAIPCCAGQVAYFAVPDLSLTGKYYTFYQLTWALIGMFRTINSSFNFLIYCIMSSKFRESLASLMWCCYTPKDMNFDKTLTKTRNKNAVCTLHL